ncbi:serine esterase [Bdellovibrio bacteriovorus]|uniref:Serine esterase n=1 Tax=Bdellovibrio bacteriovorus (strain ATCC 15356 / DSM 50701 / NCIMB 9529 / HD100) TaxID=264462 RepID=Q6MHK8_BDEBA|nr:serine esterase [Bdellovibrio bacteriovorus]AHZ83888.1 serine esterase [Bdellovibrio bacteriovorus]BEV69862.1 Carboxylesterase 2 [Bdellovibrio bacteriovorus]CAE78324.1 serine esterase [Bdellovibrio bacteriovorus HD100]
MITTTLFKHKFIPAKRKSEFLMIVLHGRGDSIKPFFSFDEELNLPEMNYLLLNAPRKFLDGYTWYGEPPYQANGVMKIREKLFDLLNDLENQGWDSKKIFLFGFSQGCLISADVGLNYPKKLAGVVGISGYFNFYPRWRNNLSLDAKKTPWLFTHGHQDDILPLEETKYGVDKLKDAGLKVEWVEMDKDHSLKDEEYPIIRRWVRDQLSDLRKN